MSNPKFRLPRRRRKSLRVAKPRRRCAARTAIGKKAVRFAGDIK